MTFSLIGRCWRSGDIGIAATTSSIAVGARVAHVRARIGAVLTQYRTDPRLGPRGLDLLASGCSAQDTIAALVASTPHIAWRQLAVMDASGDTASFTGDRVLGHLGEVRAADCVAVGNLLANGEVLDAVAAAFAASVAHPLPERLVGALEAGLVAGGEPKPLRSAALLIARRESFPFVDLRVDDGTQPIVALRALWGEYQPLADDFVVRALDPDAALPPAVPRDSG
jgi:uncharacterized Ntn-hydrolase superfamily protein